MNNIIKRNGTEHPFEAGKIAKALEKAKSDIKNLRENVKRKQQEKRNRF